MMSIRSICHVLPAGALALIAACGSPDDDDAPGPDAGPVPTGWARSIDGVTVSFSDLAVGSDEGVVVVGTFDDHLTLGELVLDAEGGTDAFIAKLDVDGRPRWARSLDGDGSGTAHAVALDGDDHVYVCGLSTGAATFDGAALPGGTFLLKLDGATGARIWAVGVGGPLDTMMDLDVTADGATIAVAGGFQDTMDLGGTRVTSAGGLDIGVAVYDDGGQPRWARAFGGIDHDRATAVVVVDGDVVIGGGHLGGFSLGGATLPRNPDATHAFLARYAGADGAHVWSSGFSGVGHAEVHALTADAGAVYAGGGFGTTIELGGPPLVSGGAADAFLAKYDAATGAHQWSTGFGGPGPELILALAIAGDEIGFAGGFAATTTIGGSTLTSAGEYDAVYGTASTATGAFRSASRAGGAGLDGATSVALTARGLWLSGIYEDDVTLFGVPLTGGDVFVGRTAR